MLIYQCHKIAKPIKSTCRSLLVFLLQTYVIEHLRLLFSNNLSFFSSSSFVRLFVQNTIVHLALRGFECFFSFLFFFLNLLFLIEERDNKIKTMHAINGLHVYVICINIFLLSANESFNLCNLSYVYSTFHLKFVQLYLYILVGFEGFFFCSNFGFVVERDEQFP